MSAIVEFDINETPNWLYDSPYADWTKPYPMDRVEEIKPGTLSDTMTTWLLNHNCSNFANGNTINGEGTTVFKFDIVLHCKSVTIFASKPEKYGDPYIIHSMWEIPS